MMRQWAGVFGAIGKISAFQPQGPRFDHRPLLRFFLYDLLYHQTFSNGGGFGAVGIRSLPSSHQVPSQIPGFAKF